MTRYAARIIMAARRTTSTHTQVKGEGHLRDIYRRIYDAAEALKDHIIVPARLMPPAAARTLVQHGGFVVDTYFDHTRNENVVKVVWPPSSAPEPKVTTSSGSQSATIDLSPAPAFVVPGPGEIGIHGFSAGRYGIIGIRKALPGELPAIPCPIHASIQAMIDGRDGSYTGVPSEDATHARKEQEEMRDAEESMREALADAEAESDATTMDLFPPGLGASAKMTPAKYDSA